MALWLPRCGADLTQIFSFPTSALASVSLSSKGVICRLMGKADAGAIACVGGADVVGTANGCAAAMTDEGAAAVTNGGAVADVLGTAVGGAAAAPSVTHLTLFLPQPQHACFLFLCS